MSRRPFDAYYTPAWPVRRFLEACPAMSGARNVLEPGAGHGNIIRAVDDFYSNPLSGVSGPRYWTAIEIRDICRTSLLTANALPLMRDFLAPEPIQGAVFDLAIGNPPYDKAMAFILKARAVALRVAFLLRLDFMATAKRGAFLRHDQPDLFVVPDRISFTEDGRTDQYDYGWFYWPDARRREGKIITLDATPLVERKAAA